MSICFLPLEKKITNIFLCIKFNIVVVVVVCATVCQKFWREKVRTYCGKCCVDLRCQFKTLKYVTVIFCGPTDKSLQSLSRLDLSRAPLTHAQAYVRTHARVQLSLIGSRAFS